MKCVKAKLQEIENNQKVRTIEYNFFSCPKLETSKGILFVTM